MGGPVGGLILKSRIPRDGLVAEYRFNGNYNDTSGNGFNGVNNGTTLTTDRKGNPNSAISLDGINDFVDIDAALAGLSTKTKGTFSAWIKLNTIPLASIIISAGDTNANERLQYNCDNANNTQFFSQVAGTVQVNVKSTNTNIVTGVWMHLALVQNAISTKDYFNGTAQTLTFLNSFNTASWFNNSTGLDNLRIGSLNFNNAGEAFFLDGFMDDIRIYDRDLSQAEITLLANE